MPEKPARRPLVIGLTGSIGMGKSETAKMFERLGIPVLSSDAVVHALYDQHGRAAEPIGRAFPGVVRNGRVDRDALAARLAGDEPAFRQVEAIVHPLVREKQQEFLAAANKRGDALVVLDIPLLFETGGEKNVDAVVVASASAPVQRARVLSRPGMTPERLAVIEQRQMPDVDKRARADFVVETDKGLEHAFESVKKIIAELRSRGTPVT